MVGMWVLGNGEDQKQMQPKKLGRQVKQKMLPLNLLKIEKIERSKE